MQTVAFKKFHGLYTTLWGLWWERIFLVNWGLNVCWFGRDAHSLYVTSSSTIKGLNMTDDSIHMHQLFYALSRSKSRGPFQISKLCICVHACYEGPAYTFNNIGTFCT